MVYWVVCRNATRFSQKQGGVFSILTFMHTNNALIGLFSWLFCGQLMVVWPEFTAVSLYIRNETWGGCWPQCFRCVEVAAVTHTVPAELKMVPRYVAPARVARMLDVSSQTVRRMIERGELEAVRVGSMMRIKRDSLMRMLGEEVADDDGR